MTLHDIGFTTRLKRAILDRGDRALVFLGNFEVEEQWAHGECTLPRLTSPGSTAVVNRMDEFALLLGGADDHVILKAAPDAGYLDHLRAVGFSLPTVHAVAAQNPQRTVTQDALADERLLKRLAELAAEGAYLSAHGVSTVEENLGAAAGIPLAAPDAATCKAVNGKVYSRRIADELGIRQPIGWSSTTVAELADAVAAAERLVDDGRTVVLKEAYGVSGKGIAVIDRSSRLRRLERMVAAQAAKSGAAVSFVIEEWVTKLADLNYQFTVSRDGDVHFDFVKTALTEQGVHKGHRLPADLPAEHVETIRQTAELLGRRLAADGYHGVVGVDAIVEGDGGLFPMLEINARNNMSTYQTALQERLMGDGHVALARHYPVRLTERIDFAAVERRLDGVLLPAPTGEGLVVTNFATVNAGSVGSGPFDGRLYAFLVADTDDRLAELDRSISERLDGDVR
ncbi:ATP-grasp domain-containing protein [Actinoplanes sp. NPDC051346]|uniref:preATP grasp domain-containing protein n=1 Tax=Actinoplanes sp. NPDC051346 TaxID=3155048 RepID=UPI00343DA7FD